jgi:hypothetical protein
VKRRLRGPTTVPNTCANRHAVDDEPRVRQNIKDALGEQRICSPSVQVIDQRIGALLQVVTGRPNRLVNRALNSLVCSGRMRWETLKDAGILLRSPQPVRRLKSFCVIDVVVDRIMAAIASLLPLAECERTVSLMVLILAFSVCCVVCCLFCVLLSRLLSNAGPPAARV